MLNSRKSLPEYTIARTGLDLFSGSKELTVIMIPFERFSVFADAVDDLFRSMDIPFNLIVIEGNAPQSVRGSLEHRQRKHKNITIIYSDHPVSIGAAVNLAAPHLTTPYALILDNDVRIPRGAAGQLLQRAKENKYGIVYPQNSTLLPRKSSPDLSFRGKSIQALAVRTCFMVSREALGRLGKFDEAVTPFTAGIDLRLAAEELGISVFNEISASMELEDGSLLWPMDVSFHAFQWNEERVHQSFLSLEKKWGIRFLEQDYALWLEQKKKESKESGKLWVFIGALMSRLKFFSPEKQPQKPAAEFSFSKAA